MTWNPEIYNRFKSERALPFYDLLSLVQPAQRMKVIDLGCGTGELTRVLAEKLPHSFVTGVDASAEMLGDIDRKENNLTFSVQTIEECLNREEKFDLIFSNAAIQWVEKHEVIFPKMIGQLETGGQLAVQMPAQHHNITNIILMEMAGSQLFSHALEDFVRSSPVLNTEQYARILFENGASSMTVLEKIYPLVMEDTDELFHWVSGTALIPYLDRLSGVNRENFRSEFKDRLRHSFQGTPVFYPFKRILIHAQFNMT